MIFSEDFIKKLELLRLNIKKLASAPEEADKRSNKAGRSPEFMSYRSYSQGDDYRYIDWNAYARLGQFFIKQFAREQAISSYIFLDNSLSMDNSKLEQAKKIAASIAYITLSNLGRVKIITYDNAMVFVGPKDINRMLSWTEKVNQAALDIKSALKQILHANNEKPALFLISDLWDKELMKNLFAFGKNVLDISIIHILSEEELKPKLNGMVELVDIESSEKKRLYIDEKEIDEYNKYLEEHLKSLRNYCLENYFNYVFIPCTMPIEESVFILLREAKILS